MELVECLSGVTYHLGRHTIWMGILCLQVCLVVPRSHNESLTRKYFVFVEIIYTNDILLPGEEYRIPREIFVKILLNVSTLFLKSEV